jgi:hypothetical protein
MAVAQLAVRPAEPASTTLVGPVDPAEPRAHAPPDAVRDVAMRQAQRLVRAGRTDAAIRCYEAWLVGAPDDAAAWRALAVQRRRAGRVREGIAALEQAIALDPSPTGQRQLRQWRAAAAPSVEPVALRTRDSDGIANVRAGVGLSLPDVGRTRTTASVTRRRTTDGLVPATVREGRVTSVWRPRAALRIEVAGGLARTGFPGANSTPRRSGDGARSPGAPGAARVTHLAATVPTGLVRARWRSSRAGPSIDVRAGRTLLDISPLLVRNRVLRDEVAAQIELPTPVGLRVRSVGRVAAIASTVDHNTRTTLGGALVLPVRGWGEMVVTGQQFAHARRSRSGYFAPRLARISEVGTYLERATDAGVTLTVDAAAGLQQVREHGGLPGPWQPAVRGTVELAVPVAPGRTVRVELDGFDGRTGSDVASFGRWRYGSASLGLRWGL